MLSEYIPNKYQVCFQCLFYPHCTVKINIIKKLKFYKYVIFVKLLDGQEALSFGVIWCYTVVYYLDFSKKACCKIFQQQKCKADVLYAYNIFRNTMLLMCPNSNGNLDFPDQYFSYLLLKNSKDTITKLSLCLLYSHSLC